MDEVLPLAENASVTEERSVLLSPSSETILSEKLLSGTDDEVLF